MPWKWRKPTRTKFLKLREAPTLSLTIECSACLVELDSDGDGWVCPSCATNWHYDCGDGAQGELGPDSGYYDEDQFEDVITDNDIAYQRGSEAVNGYVYLARDEVK